jgi:DNA polymerase-3 subunit epsilon
MKSLLSKLFNRPISLPQKWHQVAIKDIALLSLDLELTCLDPEISKVTSAGWVQGKNQQIDMSSSRYFVTRAGGDLQQSPVIHGLTEKDLAKGEHVREVINQLVPLVSDNVWVLHNASLDLGVLNRVTKALHLPKMTVITIDTMQIELYLQRKADQAIKPDSVTLENCRRRHKLPLVPCHNALDDAMATLQLLFAQLYSLSKTQQLTLNDLLHTNAVQQFDLGCESRDTLNNKNTC